MRGLSGHHSTEPVDRSRVSEGSVTCDFMPSVWEAAVCFLFSVCCWIYYSAAEDFQWAEETLDVSFMRVCEGLSRFSRGLDAHNGTWWIPISGPHDYQVNCFLQRLSPPPPPPPPPLSPSLPVRVTPPLCMRAAPVLLLPLVRQMVSRPFLSASEWLQTESTSPSGRRFSSAAAARRWSAVSRTRNFCWCYFTHRFPIWRKSRACRCSLSAASRQLCFLSFFLF